MARDRSRPVSATGSVWAGVSQARFVGPAVWSGAVTPRARMTGPCASDLAAADLTTIGLMTTGSDRGCRRTVSADAELVL